MTEAEPSMAAGYEETPPAPSEKELFLRHRDGEPGAFRQLVTAYKASVYAFVCRSGVPSADREDLFQEIFIKVHQAAHRYDAERELHPWIFTIVPRRHREALLRRSSTSSRSGCSKNMARNNIRSRAADTRHSDLDSHATEV